MERLPKNKFKIGFWNYGNMKDPIYCNVKEWTDCGMTFPMSPGCGEEDKEKVIKMLEDCEKAGIGLILCEYGTSYYAYINDGEEKYRETVRRVYRDYGKYPAFNSIHIGDEPTTDEQYEACRHCVRIVKEEMPDVHPFLNLISISAGRYGHKFLSCDDYREEIKAIGVDSIAYDCYCQLGPNGVWDDVYFNNLWYFTKMSKELGLDYTPSSLSVGCYQYRCPTEDDFRFQLYTAVAAGCKGLFWFFFYMRRPHENYRLSPIDEHGERTETYAWLSRTCRTFHRIYGDLFSHLELLDCRHAGDPYGLYTRFEGNDYILSADCTYIRSATASLFEDKRDGKLYFAIVSNSQKESGRVDLKVCGKTVKRLKQVIWDEKREDAVTCANENDTPTLTMWLAPGQMNLYEIEKR